MREASGPQRLAAISPRPNGHCCERRADWATIRAARTAFKSDWVDAESEHAPVRGPYKGRRSDHGLRLCTVQEFRGKTAGLLRSKTPVLLTRRGRLAGIFFPRPELTLPIELKRELYDVLVSDVARQLTGRRIAEDEVLKDFEASRKKRRAVRRRR